MMSVIFGVLKRSNNVLTERELKALGEPTATFAPDGSAVAIQGHVGFGYQALHTNTRSKGDHQPAVDRRGNMLALDGRLDNHKELWIQLGSDDPGLTDTQIILASFSKWGERCFSKFVGDWALALWSRKDSSLYLARDHAGSRTLYYRFVNGDLLWSTYPETLLANADVEDVDPVFALRYLACRPIGNLTPYNGLRGITPAQFFRFSGALAMTTHRHWQPSAIAQLRYKHDDDYSEHFISLFRNAVERRTAIGDPALAQLSGGMDSSAIVCMSDVIRREQGASSTDFIDTVSHYDDSEPNWNETPYFSMVEAARNKSGVHLKVSVVDRGFLPPSPAYPFPGADGRSVEAEDEYERQVGSGKYRAIVSGLGGDELLGGPPNPLPELADQLVCGRLVPLFRQSFKWSMEKREPLLQLIGETVRYSTSLYPWLASEGNQAPPWLTKSLLASQNDESVSPNPAVTLGRLPSAIDNSILWWRMLETLTHRFHAATVRREYRYPYLDRDLVDFLHSVPPSQLSRPGRRRYMMRNALRGIVPEGVLERRRKAYVSRGPTRILADNRERIRELMRDSKLAQRGWIAPKSFLAVLERLDGQTLSISLAPIMQAINLELWMRRHEKTTAPMGIVPNVR